MRKIILIILAVVIIAGAAVGAKLIIDSKTAPKPKAVKEVKIVTTDTIQNSTIPIVIPANGNLQAKRRVELYAEVTGVFRSTGKLFRTGQEYRAGETLISIDNTEFYSQVRSSRSTLNNQITAIMPDLRLDYPESYPQWQAYLDKWNMNTYTPALPEPLSDKEKYFVTGRNIYTTYYNLKNLENRLGKYRITAPFSGVLTDALVTEGTLVRNGQQLGEFIQPGSYEMQVSISAEFADLLQIGEEVSLKNISGTKTYQGTVTRVNAKVDQSSQTITVVIEVNDAELKEGMYLTANLDAQQIENAVELDRSLLQNGNGIFVIEEGKLVLKKVSPVYYSDKTVVLKGLENGTVIVSQSISGAYEGMLVKTEEQAAGNKKAENTTEEKAS
ncbi:efflux RND transporter periplasmic adaptor subunit [Nonlabens marinus]|uniref:Membrane fusion protein of RND family multidrug efflux pump n=1 Tax=Nonlabens marinus S1-08 TaxID=1454201 RepID=W8VVF1_9FLAO|nr:HlyD family efflux transporter periplasmic adaptor subunit [Nonlabens marinus]BAO55388.1 membrane fusion protein of RND family multidrug efflux pump [Nonlabens marinus S1-08]